MAEVTAQDQADADQQYGMKLAYEPSFQSRLKKKFNKLATDVGTYYALTGLEFDAGLYYTTFYDLLTKEYKHITATFGNRLMEDDVNNSAVAEGVAKIADNRNSTVDEQLALMMAVKDEKVQKFIVQSVTKSTGQITETNQKQIGESIQEALSASTVESPMTQKEVGVVVTENMNKKTASRSATISATETQNATEGSKAIEAETLNNYLIGFGVTVNTIKQWITKGDQKVRPTHRSANGQVRNIGEPFHVGSSLMQEPRDESLGASAGETINCRCVALYRMK
jgi:hypothetical protein